MPLFVVIRVEDHERQPDVDLFEVLAAVEVADMNLQQALYSATTSAHAEATKGTARWIAARHAAEAEEEGGKE